MVLKFISTLVIVTIWFSVTSDSVFLFNHSHLNKIVKTIKRVVPKKTYLNLKFL